MLYETWWLCDPILSIQDPASLSILVALVSDPLISGIFLRMVPPKVLSRPDSRGLIYSRTRHLHVLVCYWWAE